MEEASFNVCRVYRSVNPYLLHIPQHNFNDETSKNSPDKFNDLRQSMNKNTSSWVETEEEEEEALKKELLSAKKRMAKQVKMQEWLEKKEQNALQALEEEEASRKSFEAERKEKDRKFRQRAKKQKRKLEKYYQKLREEVESMDNPDADAVADADADDVDGSAEIGAPTDLTENVMDSNRFDNMTLEELKALGDSYE